MLFGDDVDPSYWDEPDEEMIAIIEEAKIARESKEKHYACPHCFKLCNILYCHWTQRQDDSLGIQLPHHTYYCEFCLEFNKGNRGEKSSWNSSWYIKGKYGEKIRK